MKNRDDNTINLELDIDPSDPKDQALLWVSRLATGESDVATLTEFERWRDSDARNGEALVDARRLWLLMGAPLEEQYAPALASLTKKSVSRSWRPLLATAASLLLATGIGYQWWNDWRFDQVSATGEQRTLALSDGSTLWLNTDSAVDVRMDAQTRHVLLARGEAFFDVVRDDNRPFTVDAGPGRITVVGTAFGVYRDGGDVVVTVQRGQVKVSAEDGSSVMVTLNHGVRVRDGTLESVDVVDAGQTLAWRTGRLMFENRPIGQVLEELKRYDSRFVVVRYPDADRLRVSSIVDLARLDEWYDTLGESLPVEVRRLGPFVWINESEAAPRRESGAHD